MTRRDPDWAVSVPAHFPSVVGATGLLPAVSGCAYNLRTITATSNGGAGTATFSVAGQTIDVAAVPAGGTEQLVFINYEVPAGSGLDVTTTTDMAITVWYSKIDASAPITKEQARANTYNAWKAQKAAGQHAIRTPNRFGGQVEG